MPQYVIDGHNLIGQGVIPGIDLQQEDDEVRLVDWLRPKKSYLSGKITLFFDGGIPGGTSNSLSGGGVTVIFAAQKRSNADRLILNKVRSSKSPKSITVVTNDIALREKLRSSGVKIIGAAEFIALIERKKQEAVAARTRSQKEKPQLSKREVEEYLQMFGFEPDEEG